uniref:HDC02990 n=1 Tax=Drosophila melanogaster TaxID=7227 RepID=Q6IH94_DROME|nr:TPA_inf: HDC02990 [Drosophila melanogaster]
MVNRNGMIYEIKLDLKSWIAEDDDEDAREKRDERFFVVWHKYIVSGSSSFGFSLNFILSSALQLHLEIFVEIEEEN